MSGNTVQKRDKIEEDLLLRFGRCSLDAELFPSWKEFLRLALDEIRFYGAQSVQVMGRLNSPDCPSDAITP
jgi:hypothetical protein